MHFSLFQTSFPGNLHLVLVLRPTGLLSTTPSPSSSTDLGFRFSQDDFLLKMPVRRGSKLSIEGWEEMFIPFISDLQSRKRTIMYFTSLMQHSPVSATHYPPPYIAYFMLPDKQVET